MPSRLRQALARLLAAPVRAEEKPLPDAKSSPTQVLIAMESLGQPVWTPRDYQTFAREGFMQNAVVYRCVRMLSEAAASVPLLLYDGPHEIEDHPLLSLIARPNAGQTRPDLLESWYGFLLVSGNAYLEAVAVGDELRELHALRPDRMKVVPGADGWPEAWEYTVGGQSLRIAGEAAPGVARILHMRLFNPANDHYGLSPIEAAATAIDLHNQASRWNKALLDNAARPSGALVYTAKDGQLSPEQFARLKGELEAGFQGARNAGRPMLLEGGLDWRAMSLSPKDMDFIEAKNSAAREIALALGVPPMLLGIPGDNTYANYQEANRSFWRQTVLPLVQRTANALSGWLAPAFGPSTLSLKPDLDAIEALSSEREALWTRLDKSTFLTPNEKRAAAGYGPLDGGDGLASKAGFNPAQLRLPAGNPSGGQWAGGDGSLIRVQAINRPGYPINILDEDLVGGHTFPRHVGKSEEYLRARIRGSRRNVGVAIVGLRRAGSFSSVEAANKLINSTIVQNLHLVRRFVAAEFPHLLPVQDVHANFGAPTGTEAFAHSNRDEPIIRPTYNVTVRLLRRSDHPRGFIVLSAWPSNRD